MALQKQQEATLYALKLFATYPQLVPYSGLTIPMRIHCDQKNKDEQLLVESLKNTSIDWTQNNEKNIPDVYIECKRKSNLSVIAYHVRLGNTNIVAPQEFSYNKIDQVSNELCFYLFGIGNDDRSINSAPALQKK